MGLASVVRWVRATVFAATCASLAAIAHVAGGGRFDRSALVLGFLLVLAPALALTGRERTLRSIVAATALSQVVLHVLLSRASEGRLAPAGAGATTGMHGMHDMDPATAAGRGMLLAHAVSVLLTSAWLEWGERGLCALARQLARVALRPLLLLRPAAVPAWPTSPARAGDGHPAPARVVLRHAVVRRGPPAGVPLRIPVPGASATGAGRSGRGSRVRFAAID